MDKGRVILVVLLTLFSVLFTSCLRSRQLIMPKDMRSSLKFCYDGQSTGLDTLIDIHGYYTWNYIYEFNNEKRTADVNFIFFEDGLFRYQVHNYGEDINDYLERIAHNPESKESKEFYRFGLWGNYNVFGDTIIAYYYDAPGTISWMGSETWFVINDDKTLTNVYSSYIDRETRNFADNEISTFVNVDTLPDPKRSWIFKSKWLKCK